MLTTPDINELTEVSFARQPREQSVLTLVHDKLGVQCGTRRALAERLNLNPKSLCYLQRGYFGSLHGWRIKTAPLELIELQEKRISHRFQNVGVQATGFQLRVQSRAYTEFYTDIPSVLSRRLEFFIAGFLKPHGLYVTIPDLQYGGKLSKKIDPSGLEVQQYQVNYREVSTHKGNNKQFRISSNTHETEAIAFRAASQFHYRWAKEYTRVATLYNEKRRAEYIAQSLLEIETLKPHMTLWKFDQALWDKCYVEVNLLPVMSQQIHSEVQA